MRGSRRCVTKSLPKPLKPENLVVSASQDSEFQLCNRKWWFHHVVRLPIVERDFQVFGTVLHGCIERWMAGDALGRVPDPVPPILVGQSPGAVVEVFPADWGQVRERGRMSAISPQEESIIRRLMNQAIERGLLMRGVSRIEEPFQRQILPDAEIVGFIDEHLPEGVSDHKSFGKAGERFLKRPGKTDEGGRPIPIDAGPESELESPNCIGHDTQMLIYGYVHLLMASERGTHIYDDEPVLLRHNQFPKDPHDAVGPRRVEAWVTSRRLREFWNYVVIPDVRGMLELRTQKDENRWSEIPGPLDSRKRDAQACSAFGGCHFRTICAHLETTQIYRERVERYKRTSAAREVETTQPTNQAKTMGIFEKYKDKIQPMTPTSPPTTPPGAIPIQPTSPTPSSADEDHYARLEKAPWADPTCKACRGTGQTINKGRPCTVCEALARKGGRPHPSDFHIVVRADGSLSWTKRQPAATPVLATSTPSPTVTGPAPSSIPPGPPGPHPAELPIKEPKEQENKRGRPKKGLRLRLGCNILKGPSTDRLSIQDVLHKVGEALATQQGKSSYYNLPAFERREILASKATEIAEELGSAIVVGRASCPDTRSLYSALIAVCDDVIEGSDPY